MTLPLFVVTSEDMALLEPHLVDRVWSALGELVKARAKAARNAPAGLLTELEEASGGELVHVNNGSAEARAMSWSEGYQAGFDDASQPGTFEDRARAEVPAVPSIHATTEPDPLQDEPPDVSPVVRPARPLGAQVQCEPGCGDWFAAGVEIGAHRRTCEAVLAFKRDRGVTMLPALATAAPLPPPPPDDFAARRDANAKAAAAATWDRNHATEEPRPAIAEPSAPKRAMTARQAGVIAAIREHGGMSAASRALDWSYKAIESHVRNLRQQGRLPADVQEIIDRNVSKGRSAGPEAVKGQIRTPEQRERMSQAQIASWQRRRGEATA